MKDRSNFNKNALRKLSEQYLATSILQNDILGFLEENISSKRSISNLLAEKAGKAPNTIYKNINELGIYNAISLLRYWQAMIEICLEFKINEIKIPNLNSLLLKYGEVLQFINYITTEDKLEILIENNLNSIIEIIMFYNLHGTSLTVLEKDLLQQLALNPIVSQMLVHRQQKHKESILERMKKK